MKNDLLEKALEDTWKNKEKFYEDYKELSMLEIIKKIENRYKEWGAAHNRSVCASPLKPLEAQPANSSA